MYGYSKHKRVSAGVASAASWSSYVNIQGANKVALELPAYGTVFGATNSNVYVQVAATAAGTYYTLKAQGVYSAASGVHDWEVPATAGSYAVVCEPAAGFDFVRVKFSTAATSGYTCYVHVMQ